MKKLLNWLGFQKQWVAELLSPGESTVIIVSRSRAATKLAELTLMDTTKTRWTPHKEYSRWRRVKP